MTVAITRQQRDTLYHALKLDLTGIGDVLIDFERGDFEGAQRLGTRYRRALMLLDELGWHELAQSQTYELRMETDELEATARHYLDKAEEELRGDPIGWIQRAEAETDLEDDYAERIANESLELRSVCTAILDQLERQKVSV